MKNLGLIALLLVTTNAISADSEATQVANSQLTLAMNDKLIQKPLVIVHSPRFELDQDATLTKVNAKLEQELTLKLEASLADQLHTLAAE